MAGKFQRSDWCTMKNRGYVRVIGANVYHGGETYTVHSVNDPAGRLVSFIADENELTLAPTVTDASVGHRKL